MISFHIILLFFSFCRLNSYSKAKGIEKANNSHYVLYGVFKEDGLLSVPHPMCSSSDTRHMEVKVPEFMSGYKAPKGTYAWCGIRFGTENLDFVLLDVCFKKKI